MKDLFMTIGITIIAVINIYCVWYMRTAQYRLPTIEQVQRQVGAEPDGRLGPETERKWKECLRKEDAEWPTKSP